MPLVLAIEPDLRQAAIVKRIVRDKVHADVAVVDSRDAAVEAMRVTVPDVLLISALLSPRDEDELVAHLRTLADADHLQTHTIPQLASALGPGEGRTARGLLSAFRRKKEPEAAPTGCDPDMFADEIRSYLERAAEHKRDRLDAQSHGRSGDYAWRAAVPSGKDPDPAVDAPVEAGASSWASPFEWKPSNHSSLSAHPESLTADPESLIADPGSLIADPASLIADFESPIAGAGSRSIAGESRSVELEARGGGRAEPVAPGGHESLMAHLRPPSGILTVSEVAAQGHQERTFTAEPLIAASEPLAPVVEPVVVTSAPIAREPVTVTPASVMIDTPVAIDAPLVIRAAGPTDTQIVTEPPAVTVASGVVVNPVAAAPAAAAARPATKNSRSTIGDKGFAVRDQGLGTRDSRLGALATWVRAENRGRDTVQNGDDVRGLLTSLAVPASVVAVGYGRGCRIRRVRVPTAREPNESEAVGAVILSKRALAEQRSRHDQPASGS